MSFLSTAQGGDAPAEIVIEPLSDCLKSRIFVKNPESIARVLTRIWLPFAIGVVEQRVNKVSCDDVADHV